MSFFSKKRIAIILSVLIALGVGFYLLVTLASPKLKYQITATKIDEQPQVPLIIEPSGDGFSFSTKFYDVEGNFNKAYLRRKLYFKPAFPFFGVDKDLVIVLTEQIVKEEKTYVYYEISGSITNLENREYKFDIIDEFGNLVDEKFVTIQDAEK